MELKPHILTVPAYSHALNEVNECFGHNLENISFPNPSCPNPGMYIDMYIVMLSLIMSEPFRIQIYNTDSLNGTLYGSAKVQEAYGKTPLISSILSGHADITTPDFTMTEGRQALLNNIGTYRWSRATCILYKKPREGVTTLNLLEFFNLNLLIAIISIAIAEKLYSPILRKLQKSKLCSVTVLRYAEKFQPWSGVVINIWYGILLGCLSGIIVSVFQRNLPPKQPFHNFPSLIQFVKSRRAKLVTDSKRIYYTYLFPSNQQNPSNIQQEFLRAAKINPPILTQSIEESMRLVFSSSQNIYLYWSYLDTQAELSVRYCGFNCLPLDVIENVLMTAYYRKSLGLNLQLSTGQAAVLEVEEQRLMEKYYHTRANCAEEHNDRYVIDLLELASCFFILMYAYGVGCGCFVLEWLLGTAKLILIQAAGKARRLYFIDSLRNHAKPSLPE